MKRIILFALCCMLMSVGFAQKYTSIKGRVIDYKLNEINLYKTVDGALQLYATTQVAPDGTYGFTLVPESAGFYTVGTERISHVIYLKGGDEVNLDVYLKEAKLNGKNTKENKALYEWEDLSANMRLKGVYFMLSRSTFRDFFPELEKFVPQLPEIKKRIKSGNKAFDDLLLKKIDYDMDYYTIMFLQTPRTEHPEKKDWPEWYSTIVSKDKFTNDEVLQFPYGVRMMNCYVGFASRNSGDDYSTDKCMSFLGDDRLKGEYVLMGARRYKSYDQYLDMMEQYGKYFVTDSQKKRAEAIGTTLYDTAPGKEAADFTYPDVNGKEVSLSDFKGKVVLVDVWATWCGPCRGEIPHLKKLEEEMRGTDVVFIGVSVDEAKDKQKWLDFIKKEELAGVQLLASGWSKITKDYKITGIPRFMVFDKKGNIVSVDAPRPSKPELKKLLLKSLKE